jgi:hypothetical protein
MERGKEKPLKNADDFKKELLEKKGACVLPQLNEHDTSKQRGCVMF